ncbi:MAG TPA: DUF1559 domain-containing protein [Gemmataceae bacterium]
MRTVRSLCNPAAAVAALLAGLCPAAPAAAQEPVEAAAAKVSFVPPDAFAFVTIDVGALNRHEALRQVVASLEKLQIGPRDQMEQRLGLPPGDIDRVTVLMPTVHERVGPPMIAVVTAKPYDKARVLTVLGARSPAQMRRGFGAGIMSGTRAIEVRPAFGEAPKAAPFPVPPPPAAPPPKEAAPDQRPEELHPIQFGPVRDRDRDDQPDLSAPYYLVGRDTVLYTVDDRTLVFLPDADQANADTLLAYVGLTLAPAREGNLSEALKAAESGKHLLVAGVNVAKLEPVVPKDLPLTFLPARALLRARSLTVTVDLGDELVLNADLRFPDAESAKRAEPVVQLLHTMLVEMIPAARKELKRRPKENEPILTLLDHAETAAKGATIRTEDGRVRLRMAMKADDAFAAALKAATVAMELSARRMKFSNDLKQFGLAFHNFHDTMGAFPAHAIYGRDGKPLLSWRVAILPYIEQDNLYRQFKLDEPWDSEHNKKLLKQMPEIYALPGVPGQKEGMTVLQVFVGAWDGKGENPPHPIFVRRPPVPVAPGFTPGMRLTSIVDGTSNTIMVIEGSEAVPWTKPEDIPFDPKGELPKLGGHYGDGAWAVFCDGAVHFIPATVNAETLRLLIMCNDGQPVPYNFDE